MSKPGDRKMDRSQLPLLRKKKTSKETAAKDKDATSTKKDKAKAFQTKPGAVASTGCLATSSPSLPREEGSSPGGRKDLGTKPKRDDRVPVNGNGIDLVVDEEEGRKPRTPIDWEWSKYVVRGGQPSDAYQKYGPEKSVPAEDIQGKAKQVPRRATGLTPPKPQYSQLPHLTGQQYFSGKLNSLGDYSPTTALHLQEDPRLPSSANGKSSHPQVFTFDQKHFDDHDSSPIYHELDPLGVYNPSAHHTYQSITEIKEEVNRLQAEAAAAAAARGPPTTVQSSNNNSGPTQSASGPTRSSLKPDSGTPRSPATLDVSPKRRSSKTLPAHLTRVCAPRSPTLLPAPSSPTVPGQQGPTRAQSIFSKLWQQKKPVAQVPKDSPSRNGEHATPSSASARNLSLGDVRLDSPTTERNFSSLYAITSPPPSAATAMTDYYRRLTGNQGVATSPLSPTSAYGMAACKNLLNFYGSAKRSFSDSSTASNSLGDRGKAAGKSGVAYENRLPWRNCRELSPVNGKSYADRWDIVRFGEPLDSPVSGGGNVSLETFKTKKSSPKPNKACSSSPCYQCPGKPQSSASPSKKDSGPVAKKTQQQKGAKRTEATNGRAQEIDRFPERQFPISRTMTNMSCLSKSQENVLSAFPLDLFTTSPPGSFESLLSEDDVFLPSSNERLNLLSPPLARTTFSSPSCGVRMAELRAVRRKSDSKSPSPEPPVSTPPPYLPFFQVTSYGANHRPPDPVTKQDVAVQTSPIRSPVRLGKNSHRYMHTIIEEDHLDQGHSTTDGKQPGVVRYVDPKTKTTAPGSSRIGNASIHGRPALSVFRREMDAFGKEEEEEEEEEETAGNLLEIISEDDDDADNSSLDSSSGKIRLSNISCSAGNGQDGDRGSAGTGRAATEDDSATDTTRLLPPLGPPQPVQPISSELSSVFSSDAECSSQTSGVSADSAMDCRSAGSKATSATSEAESIPSTVQDVEGLPKRPSRESGRSKGSKLRPPKPAKCIAPRTIDGPSNGGATVTNQQRDDVSELPRYSTQYVKAKVSEARPLASQRQPSDTQSTDTTRTQPIIKEAAVRCIESIGTNSHDNKAVAAAVDTKSCDQQAVAEVPRTVPTVPLKSGRGASQEKSPIALRTRIPGEQKKNVPSSKSQPSISSASGVRGRIIDGALPDATPDCSSSSGSQSGSQSLPSKGDSALTNRNSSLSSSLTSSSSSSLFSVADSESENVGRPRKDPLISITRPGDFKSSPPADRQDRTSTGKTAKPGLNDGKGLEKSRLAIPRVSVTRCKDRFEKTLASKQDTPAPPLTSENFCDVDDKNKFYSSPSSSNL